jgi:hypothetical protein
MILAAAGLVGTSPVTMSVAAGAHKSPYRHTHYKGQTRYAYKYCRHSPGTTGLVAGGVAGAVVGSQVIGGGIVGAAAGAVGGAVAGRAIDRTITAKNRCRVRW